MLKDDALEVADAAVRAPDPALSDLCHALSWTAVDGTIQAITAVTGAWTPKGRVFDGAVHCRRWGERGGRQQGSHWAGDWLPLGEVGHMAGRGERGGG